MRFNKIFPKIVLLACLLWGMAGCDALPLSNSTDSSLSGSGVVETVEVTAAAEIGGRVVNVYVAEGDTVQEGDLLFELDGELLQAQRQQALTSLELAQANIETAETGLAMAESNLRIAEANVETVTANAEVEILAAENALDDLYKVHEVALSEASRNIAAAQRAVRETQYRLDNFTIPTKQRDMTALEAVDVMRARLDAAREAYEPYRLASSGDATRQDLKEDLDEAQSDYDAAVRRLEYETDLASAQAALNKAMQDYETLQNGPDPDDIAILEARIHAAQTAPRQAQAAVEQAEIGLTQAQALINQAEKTVVQAQKSLDLIDVQIEKLTVTAPVSGVVLARNIQNGEVLNPGASALTIGQVEELTVTVYIPENQYGNISLGDHAKLTVDSFPGEVFDAQVIRIADKAEYTPRNVQTQEERSTTVFAIKLVVDDPGGKLKPGMPADVDFME